HLEGLYPPTQTSPGGTRCPASDGGVCSPNCGAGACVAALAVLLAVATSMMLSLIAALLLPLGTVLAFVLLNVEIADFFATGSRLTFTTGDNPPLDLYEFKVYHPVTCLIFTFRLAGDTFLYYGNPRAGRPDYDVNLVAEELLSSRRLEAGFGSEETLKKPHTLPGDAEGGSIRIWFWGVLALVVVVLLAVIARLLPKKGA
ncbi:MAG: hypothetical protein HY360_21755, partial [Verrucomicrobia bacterium]|nr:hypothetical protein [Verrucomicrobiota bacterium]